MSTVSDTRELRVVITDRVSTRRRGVSWDKYGWYLTVSSIARPHRVKNHGD